MNQKILIINPGALYGSNWSFKKDFPLQVLTLYSFLRENNLNVDVLDLERELSLPSNHREVQEYIAQAEHLIRQYSFDIVAISCFASMSYTASLAVAKICKKANTHCKIIVGGYHPTALPDDFLSEEQLFDYVVTGEGEYALLDICLGHL